MADQRILIVDDDAHLCKTLSDVLRIKGYKPLIARSAQDARCLLDEQAPLAALIDLQLGDASGLDVMREIRDRFPTTECIVLTGNASQSSAIDAVNLGAYSYVLKPYNIEQLLMTIQQAMEKRESAEALRHSEARARRLLEQQIAVNKLTLALGEMVNLDQIYQTIYEHLSALVDTWMFMIASYDDKEKRIRAEYAMFGDRPMDVTVLPPIPLAPPGRGSQSRVIHTGEPLLSGDFRSSRRSDGVEYNIHVDGTVDEGPPPSEEQDESTNSAVFVPMKIQGKPVGILQVQSRLFDAYTQDDIDLLTGMANVAAISVQNVRLHEEARQRNEGLALLNRITTASTTTQDEITILEFVCRELAQTFDIHHVGATLFNEDQTQATVVAEYQQDGSPFALGQTIDLAHDAIAQDMVQCGKLMVVEVGSDPRLTDRHHELHRRGVATMLLVPLCVDDHVVGTLGLDSLTPRLFSDQDLDLITRVAEQVAGTLIRVRLEEARRRLSTAVEQAAEGILIVDTAGIRLYVNPAFERISGYRRNELVGQKSDLLWRDDQQPVEGRDAWQTAMSGQVWQGRLSGLRRDATPYAVDATITPVRNPSSEIMYHVATLRDVTREVELEDQFRQAQKMEALGQLAGGVAHDFNNLLTVIHLSTRLLEKQIKTTDPAWKHVARIQDAGRRATNLTKQLLSFSRHEIVKPTAIDLSQATIELSKMLHRIIREDVELVLDLAKDLWTTRIDPTQVDQILMNLSVNARDAMPNGGTLTIETANVVLDADYASHHLGVEPGEYVMLAVHDTGVGMDEETQARIFEPFFTTKERGKGTGLGLATVFGIVKQHNGHIGVHSELEQGTIFKLYFPRTDQQASKAPLAAAGPKHTPQGTETILLVEDDAEVRDLALQILQSHGYRVLVASDGQDALVLSGSYDGAIDMLLTDVIMPRMNGRDLAKRLQYQRPELRVLFMSGYTNGILPKGEPLLAKPFTFESLTSTVRNVLD